jgi:hypothetical protein
MTDDARFWTTALITSRLEREIKAARTGPLRRLMARGGKPGEVIEVRSSDTPHTPILRGVCCSDKEALLASTSHYVDPTA